MALSSMSATSATGGVPVRTIATSPTAGVWVTTSSSCTTTTPVRATCLVFVACRTEKNLRHSGAKLAKPCVFPKGLARVKRNGEGER